MDKEEREYHKNVKILQKKGITVSLVPEHLLNNSEFRNGIVELYIPGEDLKRFSDTTTAWKWAIKKDYIKRIPRLELPKYIHKDWDSKALNNYFKQRLMGSK